MAFEQIEKTSILAQEEQEEVNEYIRSKLDVAPEIVLRQDQYGDGLPKGNPGEAKDGFSFFEIRPNKKKKREDAVYITSRIIERPTLEAVTENQYNAWKKKHIIARPAEFLWSKEKGMWVISDKM
jgi:hypothetical protein